jgi:hypothetical protein
MAKDSNLIYLTVGGIIVLLVFLIVQFSRRAPVRLEDCGDIVVETPTGIIKVSKKNIIRSFMKLNEIFKERYYTLKVNRRCVAEMIESITYFIRINPQFDTDRAEKQLFIIFKNTDTLYNASGAFHTIIEDDDEVFNDNFMHLIVLIDILVELLNDDICTRGILNLKPIKKIMRNNSV